jgi:GTP-binding protein
MLFLKWAGMNRIPFVICFTKSDKLSGQKLTSNLNYYRTELLKYWEFLPEIFVTSSVNKTGRDELLRFIGKLL